MKKIELSKQGWVKKGKLFAIVDDKDFRFLSRWRWHARKGSNTHYADRDRIKGGDSMHRLILNAPKGMQVDHINGNGLDNRRKNLRLATKKQNMANRGKNKNNSSGYKGVYFDGFAKSFKAQIATGRKTYNLGRYKNPKDAAVAYNIAAIQLFGEFAWTNKI